MTEEKKPMKWLHPAEVMQLHQLKQKKKALQARINSTTPSQKPGSSNRNFEGALSAKRKNPFASNSVEKRNKPDISLLDESSDQTLFKLLHLSSSDKSNLTSFNFNQLEEPVNKDEIKVIGEKWIPIDWTLKMKLRFISSKPFAWNQKLKISEEASGITSFARCLDSGDMNSSLDTSPNAKFHQCCLYWQQPSLPWINLFPRITNKIAASGNTFSLTSGIRESLHNSFTDSLRSLFQLIRTRQCPYFYACANSFTILFRAAGISGFNEMHALITPTTRGFRHLLKQEEIEFTMPLKKKKANVEGITNHKEEDDEDEDWLESMGINQEDIKQINYTQAKINQKQESEVDDSEQSLVLVEGCEVPALYSFLIHCKSIVAATGQFAGIPPTLLAPVAFNGASLTALKVRESKVTLENENYHAIELSGPILPETIHNLSSLHPKENSMTATFSNHNATLPLSKVLYSDVKKDEVTSVVFRTENLSDCGLQPSILKHFCSDDPKFISNIECLKYTSETNSYAWS